MWDSYGRLELAHQHIAELHGRSALRARRAAGATARSRWGAFRWAAGGALVRLGERVATAPARMPIAR